MAYWDAQKRREYMRAYRAAHKDMFAKYDASYRKTHKKIIKSRLAAYYLSHKADYRRRRRAWAQANPERVKQSRRKWVESHKEQIALADACRDRFGTRKIPPELKQTYDLYRQLKREVRNGNEDSQRFA